MEIKVNFKDGRNPVSCKHGRQCTQNNTKQQQSTDILKANGLSDREGQIDEKSHSKLILEGHSRFYLASSPQM